MSDSRSSFKQWLQNAEFFFWIQGKPGSGKSTLMFHLSRQEKEVLDQLNSASRGIFKIAYFFFDFRAGRGIANNLEGLLRSLYGQIVRANPKESSGLAELYSGPRWSAQSLDLNVLRDSLAQLLRRLPVNFCLFIDGLDEYQGNIIDLLEFLKTLPHKLQGEKILKICLASRPEPVLVLALESQPGLKMHDHNYVGIESYASIAIKNLQLSSLDESSLLKFPSGIAERAHGIFLWARFALTEVVESYASGESIDQLILRLEALPPSLKELYTTILMRIPERDLNDARLLFQLVCSNVEQVTIRQIKEAEAIAWGRFQDFEIEKPYALERFQKRLRAKGRGLLEEVSNSDGDHNLVKTIHRSVDTFLQCKGWLTGLNINGQSFPSPEVLWVYVCCNLIEHLGNRKRKYHRSKVGKTLEEFVLIPKGLDPSFLPYVLRNIFRYARKMEKQGESSYKYLSLILPSMGMMFRDYNLNHFGPHSIIYVNIDILNRAQESQPWQIAVAKGVTLAVEEAIKLGNYHPIPNGHDIWLALQYWIRDYEFMMPDFENCERLILVLIEAGVSPGTADIIQCFHSGNRSILELLLLHCKPHGKIKFDRSTLYVPDSLDAVALENYTYAGKPVGPLWELARADTWFFSEFESMLEYLLERGEDLNEICGPGGTMLHAVLIDFVQPRHMGQGGIRQVLFSPDSLLQIIC